MIRRFVALAVAGAASLVPALPAHAHGAPTTPISRTAACGGNGGTATGSAACKAARKANGGPIGSFDNLRLAGVGGNDRKAVPDGRLCSGGIDAYRGLDLARDDFPSTTVTAGRTLAIRYRTTIPHAGSFRIYLTEQGFDPESALRWDDLASRPIAEVTDPPVRNGAYVMSARLPKDRTGRHILYIVWQNTSTPDTYYSCSDLVFKAAATKAPEPAPAKTRSTAAPAPPVTEPAAGETSPAAPVTGEPAEPRALTPVGDESQVTLGHSIVLGALVVGIGAGLWAAIGGLLRRRRENR